MKYVRLAQLIFTGYGLVFFAYLHLSILLRLPLFEAFFRGGLVVFGLGLFPMWMVACLSLGQRARKNREQYWEELLAECPFPHLVKKYGKAVWFYLCGMSAMFIILPDSWGWWAHYLSAAGVPCFFMGFYGPAFLLAWIDWKKALPGNGE